MNRLKKELRNKGVMLESDYPFIPYRENGTELLGIEVDSENCIVTEFYTSIIIRMQLRDNGKIVMWHKQEVKNESNEYDQQQRAQGR